MSSLSASPSPAPFALPSSSSVSCSPLKTPARMWSSAPASTAPSSPVPAPETETEDEDMPFKRDAEVSAWSSCINFRDINISRVWRVQDDDDDDSSPFLRGVPLSVGGVACTVARAEGDTSKEQNTDASNSKAGDMEELEDEDELAAGGVRKCTMRESSVAECSRVAQAKWACREWSGRGQMGLHRIV
ncbi:hypothetical protein B0H13DRAFT_2306948 [Mycena leptocephala]|nr:hypothetical protein B0H13DRAFT_2306948 [Mycena leptocephala]